MKKFENKDFVHWHVHSHMSKFDCLSEVDSLVMQARKMGFPALAITDHGTVMAFISFIRACKATTDKKGKPIPYAPIKPILGCEFYLSRKMDIGQNEEKRDTARIKLNQPDGRRGNRHLNLYARNFEGYKNLCRMSQRSYTEGFYYDPRISLDLISAHSEGVMCGSACLSSVINANLMHGRYDQAREACGTFKDIFGENFFLEVMYHGIREEKEIVPSILKLSTELDIPVICTNDSHYIYKDQGASQEVLLCMSQQKCMKDDTRLRFKHKEFYLKSAQEMAELFGHIPHCLTNTTILAERIDTADIEENLFGGMRLPEFDIPKEYKNPFDYLSFLAWEGMKKVGWSNSEKHIAALKMELGDVKIAYENNDYDFATYFLIVRDYIKEAKDRGVLVGAGRGSGYSSVLLRCIEITYGVDPLEYGLLWERFLGFSSQKFIKESDFGFKNMEKHLSLVGADDREVEDDMGGVDRY